MTTQATGALNPYQPPPESVSAVASDGPCEVSFQVNRNRLRRHAEEYYLLHWHQNRLLFTSVLLIGFSLVIVVGATMVNPFWFFPALVAVMALSSVIYLGLISDAKRKLRRRRLEKGLATSEMMTLRSDPTQISLSTGMTTYQWPNKDVVSYRTRHGMLICPEPLLYVFVPKNSSFQAPSYRQFAKLIESRIARNAVVNPDD